MKLSRSFARLLSLSILLSSVAHAGATHTASVDLDLVQVDEKGKEHNLDSRSGDFSLDWNTRKCQIETKKQFVYCDLDTSTDITNSKGELVMKSLPQAHFDVAMIDALIRTMGADDKRTKNIISRIVSDTSSSRQKGFDLPFYTCGDCEKNGKDLQLFSAYASYVIREVSMEHASLGAKKLILRLKIKNMKAVKGAFSIIGNSNASSYGH